MTFLRQTFQPQTFQLFIPMVQKFIVEKSGVESWGLILGLKSLGLRCFSTIKNMSSFVSILLLRSNAANLPSILPVDYSSTMPNSIIEFVEILHWRFVTSLTWALALVPLKRCRLSSQQSTTPLKQCSKSASKTIKDLHRGLTVCGDFGLWSPIKTPKVSEYNPK